MSFYTLAPPQLSEWGWLFGFALVSLALVALAVLADAIYEGYRERSSRVRRPPAKAEAEQLPGLADETSQARKKAA